MNSGWMYHVYRIQATAAYSSLCFFIFLSLQFLNIENFCHTFRRNCEAFKVEIWYNVDNGWMYSVYGNQAAAYLSLYFFIFLSLQFSNIKIFVTLFPSHFPITLFPGNVMPTHSKLGAHMLNGPIKSYCWFFIVFLLFKHWSFCHIFLGNCEWGTETWNLI